MVGLLGLNPTGQIVGKKSEYKTKEEFIDAVLKEEGKEIEPYEVVEGYMRYFPKGTQDTQLEFGKGEGVYISVDKLARGAFEVWIV